MALSNKRMMTDDLRKQLESKTKEQLIEHILNAHEKQKRISDGMKLGARSAAIKRSEEAKKKRDAIKEIMERILVSLPPDGQRRKALVSHVLKIGQDDPNITCGYRESTIEVIAKEVLAVHNRKYKSKRTGKI